MTEKLSLQLALVLPGVPDERDACIGRLTDKLQAQGLELVLFSLGYALEHLAMDRARHAMEALADLAPKTAWVVRDGIELDLPVDKLLRGDQVLVRPGQRIPADGRVLEGRSAVDQAAITGESMPVDKLAEAWVFAGTVNGEGLLRVEVCKLARDSSLARMVRLVAEAQTAKHPLSASSQSSRRCLSRWCSRACWRSS